MNGSGCIAGGERGRVVNEEATELEVRRWVRRVALIAALAGIIWCGLQIWELASRTYVTAKVEGLIPQDGQCRRPSGRYQNCSQSKVVVTFIPESAKEEVRAEFLIPQKGVTLQAGNPILIGYRKDNTQDVELPDLSGLMQTPLGFLLTALLVLGLERLTR